MSTPIPTPPSRDETVARLAVRYPGASRVFMRHNVDFCCGGNRRLTDACAAAGLDPDGVLREILLDNETAGATNWEERPLAELIDHILAVHHEPLRTELPRLMAMADKVQQVHGDKDPSRLAALAGAVRALAYELDAHMAKEENALFPWLRSGRGATAGGPIRVMHTEHERCAQLLSEIRGHTDQFTPPRGACATWRALYLGLEALDADLREHMHLENNVLFPRALVADAS